MLNRLGMSLVVLLACVSCAQAPKSDRLFVGGMVHAGNEVSKIAIAVADGRIIALVPPQEEAKWRKSAKEVIDLAGVHVYPGFTEGHGHFVGYGAALEQVNLNSCTSFAEVVAKVKAAAATLPPGAWVKGRGWDQNRWTDKAFPTHQALSAAVPDHPVALSRVDGHAILTNAKGLELAGITARTADPAGGRILRDTKGNPTGVFVDAAEGLIGAVMPPTSEADIIRHVALASRALTEYGYTEFHDAGTGAETLAVLRKLQREGKLTIRVYCMLDGGDDGLLASEFATGPALTQDGMLAVRGVKLYADGALGSRGAWLSTPYADEPSSRGLEVTAAARLEEIIRKSVTAGFQPAIHAIGDAAVTRCLDIYEKVGEGKSLSVRPRIEHAQFIRPSDVPRFAALGVIASMQPTHCTSDMPWVPTRVGPDRVSWAYRWRSLLVANASLSFGSDVPVEDPDLHRGLLAAVTRRTPQGTPAEGWNPAEALTLPEAISAFTEWPAYAAFEENWRGRIAPTYAADLTITDRAFTSGEPAGILQVNVVRTVVAGRDRFVRGR